MVSVQVVESKLREDDEGDKVKIWVGGAVKGWAVIRNDGAITGGAVTRNDGVRVGTVLGSGTGDFDDGATEGTGFVRVVLQGIEFLLCWS